MEMKHTPGPWLLTHEPGRGTFHIGVRVDDWRVRVIAATPTSEDNDSQEQAANARLIAAAPELLAALIAVDDFISGKPDTLEPFGIVRSAIAKATGEDR